MTPTASRFQVPWGFPGTLDLSFPEFWTNIQTHEPDLSNPLAHYLDAAAQAIAQPIAGPRLDDLNLGPDSRVAIVVDDPSRWTPVDAVLPLVLDRLHAIGVPAPAIQIVAGVGRHQAVDAEAMAARVGPEIVERYTCHSPPVDDLSAYVDLGATPDGIPVRIHRPVVESDLRILIGSVLPHLQAGFGGGIKLLAPGCAHRSTLGAIHGKGLGDRSIDAARLLGSHPRVNPMRRAIQQIADKLGPCFSISHVLGAPGSIFRVLAGDPAVVEDALADEVARRYQASPDALADVVVAGNHPWPGDPMQSFKVLLNHRSAAKPNGVLVGLFWTDPEEIDRSFPLGGLRAISATGAAGAAFLRNGLALADQTAARLNLAASFMIRWARELVVDRQVFVYAPPLRDRLGRRLGPVRLHADLSELWADVQRSMQSQGIESPRVALFPWGGLTYVPHPDGPLNAAETAPAV